MLTDDEVAAAVAAAVRAPSVHNTQPWRFQRHADTVDVRADRERLLPVEDPLGRELHISCGAALRQLVLALRAEGHDVACDLLPDQDQPDLLARAHVRGPRAATLPELDLYRALWTRHTDRAPFASDPVDPAVVQRLRSLVEAEGCSLDVVEHDEGPVVAVLASRAEHALETERGLREEQDRWTTEAPAREGVPRTRDGVRASDVPLRRFGSPGDVGSDDPPAPERPLLLVLGTPADEPADWLTAGWALADVLLTLEHLGLAASPLTQVLELPALRAQLRGALCLQDQPQVLLRVGVPGPVRDPAPDRRQVHDVLS